MPAAGVTGGNVIWTPLPTRLTIWLWYLVTTGSTSPKKRNSAPRASALGVRVRRSHSSRQRFIRPSRAVCWAALVMSLLGAGAGQGEEGCFQVGGDRLAGDLAGAAGGDDRGDAVLARLDAGGVDPEGVGPDRFNPGRPLLTGHRSGHRCG